MNSKTKVNQVWQNFVGRKLSLELLQEIQELVKKDFSRVKLAVREIPPTSVEIQIGEDKFVVNLNGIAVPEKIVTRDRGLGDTIKRITSTLGISQCDGCKRRQEMLNRKFPYRKK